MAEDNQVTSESSELDSSDKKKLLENEDSFNGPRFNPPLYKQRYKLVADILAEEDVHKVADFGSAEGKIINYLKEASCIEEINAVDISRSTIEEALFLSKPLMCDYLHPRCTPLTVRLWQGDVTRFDSRFAHLDAVTMVEVIEHLEAPVLESLPQNLFGGMKPPLVIITTPNSDFNVLFPGFTGFRHWDHKFEWSREEFKQWCDCQAEQYGYTVEYSGVGDPPSDKQHVGHCSQIAVFKRLHEKEETEDNVQKDDSYELVLESVHPFKQKMTREEEISHEAEYYIRKLALDIRHKYESLEWEDEDRENEEVTEDEEREDEYGIWVKLENLAGLPKIKDLITSVDELRDILSNTNFKLSEDGRFVIYQLESVSDVGAYHYDDSNEEAEEEEVQWLVEHNDDSQTSEKWSDSWENESSHSTKAYNKPENWNLPLEVTNPELFKKQQENEMSGYAQGYHQGARTISSKLDYNISSRFKKCYEWCYKNYSIVQGQFEDDNRHIDRGNEFEDITMKGVCDRLQDMQLIHGNETHSNQTGNLGSDYGCKVDKQADNEEKICNANQEQDGFHCNGEWSESEWDFIPFLGLVSYAACWHKPESKIDDEQFIDELG